MSGAEAPAAPATRYVLDGVIAIPQTPFDANNRVDTESLERGVADRILAGCAGLLVPVVASEVSRLSLDERRLVLTTVVRCARGRVPVIAGASSTDLGETRSMAALAAELGCAGVVVQPPAQLRGDAQLLVSYLEGVASAGPEMLMLQDLEWNGPGLPVDLIAHLFDRIERFRCIKVETVPAGSKYTAILEATGGRMHVSGGWAVTQLIEALDRGIHAVMPGGLHWILVAIMTRYRCGDRAGARQLFDRLLPILAWQGQHIDISNRFLKMLAVRQGIFSGDAVRCPDVTLDAHHRRIAEELIEAALELHQEVGWRAP